MVTYQSTVNSAHGLSCRLLVAMALGCALQSGQGAEIDEIQVWGSARDSREGPVQVLTPQDLASAMVATPEDLVKYEPSLVVRRRFVGDANGTLGMRGANMFQTTRSMVFADGVPLHYLLQSRWDGAPRWSLIAASEVERVEVLYGPFSAEYGGNAMGGVVLMESRIPQQREFHFDTMVMMQNFSAYGFDGALGGHRTFFSYGDKFGDLSLYLSYNRLDNQSQPQSYFPSGQGGVSEAQAVSGAIPGFNELGQAAHYFGDTGITDSRTDNFKLKLGYSWQGWDALLNLALEDRQTDNLAPGNYLRDEAGVPVWSGTVSQGGSQFQVPASRFGVSQGHRQSLSAGLRIKGELSPDLSLESNFNGFGIIRDENRQSARNPQDPEYSPLGQLTDFGDTGWRSAEIKLRYHPPQVDGLKLTTGLRHEAYRLQQDVLTSLDYRRGSRDGYQARSGGESRLDAAFVQAQWLLGSRWDLGLGGRLESWQSQSGHYSEMTGDGLQQVDLPSRRLQRFSPKFSLGYFINDQWQLRYALARAYRFAIVEEMFSQFQAFNTINHANPDLMPERGLHHNLSLQRGLASGELVLNLFQENIGDVIEAQAMVLGGGQSVRTFLPITQVQTRGMELVWNQRELLLPGLGLRFNLAYTHSMITRNFTDPSIEGNRFPRMPTWRANLLLNYQIAPTLDVGGGLRYASNSFGRLDNLDRQSRVFGAQDDYLFVNLKANWRPTGQWQFGLGVENLLDRQAFVAHPWPGRTLFVEGKFRL